MECNDRKMTHIKKYRNRKFVELKLSNVVHNEHDMMNDNIRGWIHSIIVKVVTA